MRVVLGSDHGGYETKLAAIEYLKENNIEYIDLGCSSLESVDYPSFGIKVGEYVRDNSDVVGIVVCTTGIGISIACNKVKGIRCALCFNEKVAMMTRLHNNSNVLALPVWLLQLISNQVNAPSLIVNVPILATMSGSIISIALAPIFIVTLSKLYLSVTL